MILREVKQLQSQALGFEVRLRLEEELEGVAAECCAVTSRGERVMASRRSFGAIVRTFECD